MAKLIARDVQLKVDGVDLSSHLQKITENFQWDNKDVTGMGATFKTRLLGLADATIVCDFFQDYDSGSVYATLKPLAGSNTPFEVELVPVKSVAVGATNPRIVMWCVLDKFDPVDAQVGDASMMTGVTFFNALDAGPQYFTT